MNKQVLISLIKECIDEIIHESQKQVNTDLIKRLKINAVLKKYPHADKDVVEKYVNANLGKGVTLRQLELDANEQNWSTETTKAIYSLLSGKKARKK